MTEHGMALLFMAFALLFALTVGPAGGRRRRKRVRREHRGLRAGYTLYDAAKERLRRTPFHDMGHPARIEIMELLKRADGEPAPPAIHAEIRVLLGEMALVTGEREQAVDHFRSALRWNPDASVRRLLERLERTDLLSLRSS